MLLNRYKNGFAHDVSILTIGTTIAQVFPFLLYPLIGRLYTPEQTAVLATYTSIVSMIQVVSTGKYEGAVFLAETDQDAANIVILALSICLTISIIVCIPLFFIPGLFDNFVNIDIGWLIYLIPVSIISISIFDIYNEWCIRKKYFKKLAINKITNSMAVNFGKVSLAYTPFQNVGLVIGDVVGRVITMTACVVRICVSDYKVLCSVSYRGIKSQARKYDIFPRFSVPAQFLNTIGVSMPVIILATYYTDIDVGLFSMTLAVMHVPIGVVGRSVRDVFRKKVRDTYGKSSIKTIFLKLLWKVLVFSFFVALIGTYFLPWIFSTVLGERWFMSGVYSQLLVPMLITNFVSTCVDGTVIVAKKMKQAFLWQILYCSCSILPVIISIWLKTDFIMFVIIFSLFRVVSELALIIMSYYYAIWLDKHNIKG